MPHKHTPVPRGEWEKLILRAELTTATKTVALAAATYGDPDGSKVGPSVSRLAVELGWSQRHVKDQLSILRTYGLIEAAAQSSPGRPTRYRLTMPDDLGTIPMRTDMDGYPVMLGPRKAGRGGAKPKAARTPVADEQPPGNPGSDREDYGTEPEFQPEGTGVPAAGRLPELQFHDGGTGVPAKGEPEFPAQEAPEGTGVPLTQRPSEPQFPQRGTPVPAKGNSDSPDPKGPYLDHSDVQHALPPTGARPDADENHESTGPDLHTAHRAARRALDAAPEDARNLALSQASGELMERDIRGAERVRLTIIRAAELLIEAGA